MKNEILTPCPCCKKNSITEIGVYEICMYCGWEDDPSQSANPNLAGGANQHSLNEAQRLWLRSQCSDQPISKTDTQ